MKTLNKADLEVLWAENSIPATWVKKAIEKKNIPFYQAHETYKTLYTSDSGIIVAFRIVGPIPETVETCTFDEVLRLKK